MTFTEEELKTINEAHMKNIQENNKIISIQEFMRNILNNSLKGSK